MIMNYIHKFNTLELVLLAESNRFVAVSFDETVLELFVNNFGSIPAPWPLVPFDMENLENETFLQGCLADKTKFSDWSYDKASDMLRESLVYGWPIDWHFAQTVLVPVQSLCSGCFNILTLVVEQNGLNALSFLLGINLAKYTGWCGLKLNASDFEWIFIFSIDYTDIVQDFLNLFANNVNKVQEVKVDSSGLRIIGKGD